MPWMQAHAASWLALGHPTPADMDRMWAQHLPFAPAGMMWLGFDNDPKGTFCTFPHGSPKSWAHTFALAWSVDNGLQYDVFELPPFFGKASLHEGVAAKPPKGVLCRRSRATRA